MRSVMTSCKTRLCRSRDITAGSFYLMTTRQTSLRESDECTRHLCPSIEHQPHLETHQDSSQLSVVRCLRASSCKFHIVSLLCGKGASKLCTPAKSQNNYSEYFTDVSCSFIPKLCHFSWYAPRRQPTREEQSNHGDNTARRLQTQQRHQQQ